MGDSLKKEARELGSMVVKHIMEKILPMENISPASLDYRDYEHHNIPNCDYDIIGIYKSGNPFRYVWEVKVDYYDNNDYPLEMITAIANDKLKVQPGRHEVGGATWKAAKQWSDTNKGKGKAGLGEIDANELENKFDCIHMTLLIKHAQSKAYYVRTKYLQEVMQKDKYDIIVARNINSHGYEYNTLSWAMPIADIKTVAKELDIKAYIEMTKGK